MYKSLEEICEMTTKEGKPFWKIVQEDDCREQGISEGKAFEQMRGMYQAMREADDNYDGKLKSASGLVGTDGEKMHAAREAGTLLCGKFIGKVMEKALKTGESNACMKRIVAAPTAGSCGVVPAVFLTLEEEKHFSEEKMVEALYVAAGIGGVIANRAFLAGAAGGCQLFALPICFRPLRCFGISGHITAQSDFYQIGKAHFLQSVPPAFESNAFAELSFCRGSKHGIDMFAVH